MQGKRLGPGEYIGMDSAYIPPLESHWPNKEDKTWMEIWRQKCMNIVKRGIQKGFQRQGNPCPLRMGEGELCERGFLGPLLWEQTLRWRFVCRWLTKDAVRINSCGGVKEAGLGRGDAEATRRHNKWLQQTSQGASELGWPLSVVPNWGKGANPYDPHLPVNEYGLPTGKDAGFHELLPLLTFWTCLRPNLLCTLLPCSKHTGLGLLCHFFLAEALIG